MASFLKIFKCTGCNQKLRLTKFNCPEKYECVFCEVHEVEYQLIELDKLRTVNTTLGGELVV